LLGKRASLARIRNFLPGEQLVAHIRRLLLICCVFIAACGSAPLSNTAQPSPTVPVSTPTLLPTVVPTNVTVCANGGCLSTQQWAANINKAISSQAVGYAYLIISHHKVVYEHVEGLARTNTDGPAIPLTADTRINIASLTKTITAVAVLKLLTQKHISLDSPMYPYLPKSWTLGVNIKTITFRELLTHRSGIRSTIFEQSYDNMKNLIAAGILLDNKIYHYDNYNFALFRILIPYINGFDDSQTSNLDTATSQRYLDYMNSVYGPALAISCTEGSNGGTYALAYSLPAATNPGKDWGDWFTTCGAGGIQMSLDELAQFLLQLNQGAFLNADELQQMYQGYLGWDYPYADRQHGDCITKNGALIWNYRFYGTALSTLLTYCPSLDLGFIGIANSRLDTDTVLKDGYGFPGSWDDLVQTAFANSWK
jgi:CubicO group peptidase (beta-lactamase class C family)